MPRKPAETFHASGPPGSDQSVIWSWLALPKPGVYRIRHGVEIAR